MAPETEIKTEAFLEQGRLLFAGPCDFVIGCVRLDQVPPIDVAEVAFAGRSNVGKSSLLNALTGRKALARTSNTPGRTREINFFDLGGRLMLADLPGYGYAKAPKSAIKQWTGLVDAYLRGRAELRRTCLLVDARHGLKDSDRAVMTMLDKAAQPYQVILTKADKVQAGPLSGLVERTGNELAKHPAAHPEIAVTSSRKGTGIPELRASLCELAEKPTVLR